MSTRRWRLRRERRARSKTAAANWKAKESAKKLTTSQCSESTRPVSAAAGETGMAPTFADRGGSHVGYPAFESTKRERVRPPVERFSRAVVSSGGKVGSGSSPHVA